MSRHDDNPLGPLARADVPGLEPSARDLIEAGLRVQHANGRGAPRRTGIPRWLVVVPALAAVLLIATVALVLRDESAVAALEVRDAENVVVTLPDGQMITDPADGFGLIDGAVVVVGDDGTVTIDDVMLGPGSVVTVRDGRLVTDVVGTTTTDRPTPSDEPESVADRPPGDEHSSTTASPTTVAPEPPPLDTRPIDPGDADRPRDEPPPTTRSSLPPEDARPPVRDAPPVGDAPEPGDVEPGDVEPDGVEPDGGVDIAVALRVDTRDGGVRVAWRAEGITDERWRVVVLRTTDGSAPEGSRSATLVGEGHSGEIVERRRDLPETIEALRYQVLVLDQRDGVIARSAVQTVRPSGS